jgi:BolA protein
MGKVSEVIRRKLSAGLQPTQLDILDESDRHAGHAGARAGGESHFAVTVESARFAGLGRVARQRLVMGLLADELAGPVHALSIKALAPGEG